MIVFRDFLENGSNDFDKTLPNGRGNRYEAFAKNRTSKSSSVLEIFIHKVQIFEKTAKVVSKDRSISRERLELPKLRFDIQNLRKIAFPEGLIRFLPTCRLLCENSTQR